MTTSVYASPMRYVDPEVEEAVQREVERERVMDLAKAPKLKKKAELEAARQIAEEEQSLSRIVAVRGDSVVPRKTYWLWRDRVPLGGLTMLAGKGDVSKSTVFAQFAAWLTRGEMKGVYYGNPQNVGYVFCEDSLEETIIPRMMAHGTDLSKVHFLEVEGPLGKRAITLPRDDELLREFIRDNQLAVVFLDPLSAYVSGKKNDQGEMRTTFQAVNKIGIDTRCSIFGLAHTRKAGAQDIIEAIMGSSEQANVARSVLGLVQDPEEDGARLLSVEKLNVGQKHKLTTLRFKVNSVLVPTADGPSSMPQIEWLAEIEDTASDILADQLLGRGNLDECIVWLRSYILSQGGEAPSAEVKEAAKSKKFSESMLNRARKPARVVSRRLSEVPPKTVWTVLPQTETH